MTTSTSVLASCLVIVTAACTLSEDANKPGLRPSTPAEGGAPTAVDGGASDASSQSTPPPTPTAREPAPTCTATFTQTTGPNGDRYRAQILTTNATRCTYTVNSGSTPTLLPSCNFVFDGGPVDFDGPGRQTVNVAAEGPGGVARCALPLTIACELSVSPSGDGAATDLFTTTLRSIAGATSCKVSIDGGTPADLTACDVATSALGTSLGGTGSHTLSVTVQDAQGLVGTCNTTYVVK